MVDQKSGIIVIQFDNVILETDYEMYRNLFTDKITLNQFCDITKYIPLSDFNKRDHRSFFTDLLKPNLNVKQKQLGEFLIIKNSYNVYYNNCKQTNISKNILNNDIYLGMPQIKNIVILVEYPKGVTSIRDAKIRYIKENYKNEKIKILTMESDADIYDILMKSYPNWSVFITDDELYIKTIAEKSKSLENKEFDILSRNYNKYDKIVDILIYEKNGTICRYD